MIDTHCRKLAQTCTLIAVLAGGLTASAGAATADLIRDDWGVPHIYAESEPAGYYALGFAQAEDQGERVLYMVRMALGETAAIDGPAMLAADLESRRWRHAEESRAALDRLDAHVVANYRAYAQGFNRWFAENPARAPAWRFPLEPWHLVAIPRMLLWDPYMAGDGLADCRKASAGPATVRASNAWVVHRERTAERVMMLLSDPHGGIDGGFLYEYRMHAGNLHSAGFSVGGMMLLANTRTLAWAMTTGAPDVSDCYEVETDPANPLRYRFDGVWQEMRTHKVIIDVKGEPPRNETFAYTRHNGVDSPVVARSGTRAYVVSTPYMHEAWRFDAEIDRLNHARSVAEARRALRTMGMFGQNLLFADARGNSWYVRAGRAPRRPPGIDWTRPVPGNGSQTQWLGIHALADLVQTANPRAGWLQNNNVAPDSMSSPPLIRATDYAGYLFNDDPGRHTLRGERAKAVLSAANSMTESDAIELALDEQWIATTPWLRTLERAAQRSPPADARARDLLGELRRFDGQARADSPVALKYWLWRQEVHERLGVPAAEEALRDAWRA